MKQLKSEEDVLEAIGAKDFRSIKKDQIISFVSELPRMNKDLAIKCVEQFPEFVKTSNEMIDVMSTLCNDMIKSGHIENQAAIESYQRVLDDLHFIITKPDLSDEMAKHFIEMEVEVGDKIARQANTHKEWLSKVLTPVAALFAAIIGVGGTILGVKIWKS